jgi:hypothetical protein
MLGTEDVLKASNRMQEAANTFANAVSNLEQILRDQNTRLEQMLDYYTKQLTEALRTH